MRGAGVVGVLGVAGAVVWAVLPSGGSPSLAGDRTAVSAAATAVAAPAQAGTGLLARYYASSDATGASTLRIDRSVRGQFHRGHTRVAPYAVTWLTQVAPATTAATTFTVQANGPVRLAVDGQPLVSQWKRQPGGSWSGTIPLTAEKKVWLRLDFSAPTGREQVHLLWSTAGSRARSVPSKRLYPPPVPPVAPTPKPTPTTPTPPPTPSPKPTTPVTSPPVTRPTSGGKAPDLHGVYADSIGQLSQWASFSGTAPNVVTAFSARGSWAEIEAPWIGQALGSFSGTWSIAQPLFPESGSQAGNLSTCATGAYDSHWAAFGKWLVAQGRANTFVRLGWEFNGNWFPWAASNPTAWVACFQHEAAALKAADPQVRIDWNLNAHGHQTPVGAFSLYPGDQYVDVIGIDSYDEYPPSLTEAQWDAQCNGPEGLCTTIAFARAHHKLFSVPEWGVVATHDTGAGAAGQAGGDNPFYIQKMHETFAANADVLAYESYFGNADAGNVHSSLVGPDENPRSAAEYAQLF